MTEYHSTRRIRAFQIADMAPFDPFEEEVTESDAMLLRGARPDDRIVVGLDFLLRYRPQIGGFYCEPLHGGELDGSGYYLSEHAFRDTYTRSGGQPR